MKDLHDQYLRGVGELLQAIEPTNADYLTVLTLQGRLAQAISETRQYGPTDNARSEIARVTTELDRLCLVHLGQSFQSLCGIGQMHEASHAQVRHNLPQPDYGRFIGRDTELAQIVQILRPYPYSQEHLVTIDGIGGIGKSALALEVAYRFLHKPDALPEAERFDAIVWTSAKQTALTIEGVVQRKQTLRTLDEIYTTISITLEREDITRARLEEQHQIIRKALTQQRVLLIVDNLETIDDEAVMEFLRELPAPTKAIVTTRHRLDVAYPIRLTGMGWNDAKNLISQECHKKNVALTNQEAYKLYKRTGGMPLALVWSIAQIGFGYSIDVVLTRLGNPKGHIAQFCFEGAMMRIRDTGAHKLLMALALFATDASRETLGQVAGIGGDILSRDEGLVELEKLSLVNKLSDRFSMLPLTRSYSLNELDSYRSFANEAKKRWVTQLTELLRKPADQYWIQDQETILREGENYLSLLDWATNSNDTDTALAVIQPAVLYLQYTGRRVEALKLAILGQENTRQHQNKSIQAWLYVDIGWILSQQGSYEDAIVQIDMGLKDYKEIQDNMGVCFAKCFLAQALRHAGKVLEAEQTLQQAADEASKLDYREGICIAEFERGKLARDQQDWNSAYTHFALAYQAVLALDENFTDIFSLAVRGNYGSSLMKLDRQADARDVTLQVLALLKKWRYLSFASNFTARMHLQAAETELGLGNPSQAIPHIELAMDLYISTKYEEGIKQAQQLLIKSRL